VVLGDGLANDGVTATPPIWMGVAAGLGDPADDATAGCCLLALAPIFFTLLVSKLLSLIFLKFNYLSYLKY
jgi:hypothetical protein